MAAPKMEPFHAAAREGDVAGLEAYMRKLSRADRESFDWNRVSSATHTWQTALHLAAEGGHYDACLFLLSQGSVRIDEVDKELYTPLHCAASGLHLNVCTLLLTRGANPNAKNAAANTPLHYIARAEYNEDLLELLDLCVERGANVEAKNKYGETLLASCAGRPASAETVRWLIDHGADVTARDAFGVTPLHRAVEANSPLICLLLLKQGADPTASCEKLGTPINLAERLPDVTVASLLAQAKDLHEGRLFTHGHSTYHDFEDPDMQAGHAGSGATASSRKPSAAAAAAAGGGGASSSASSSPASSAPSSPSASTAAAAARGKKSKRPHRPRRRIGANNKTESQHFAREDDMTFQQRDEGAGAGAEGGSADAGAGAAAGGGGGGGGGRDDGPPPLGIDEGIEAELSRSGSGREILAQHEQLCRSHGTDMGCSRDHGDDHPHGGDSSSAPLSTSTEARNAADLWFYPTLSRTAADEMMSARPTRCFLVRGSSVPGCYALTVGDREAWSHLLISALVREPEQSDVDAAAAAGQPAPEAILAGYQIDQAQNEGIATADCSVYASIQDLVAQSPELKGAAPIGALLAAAAAVGGGGGGDGDGAGGDGGSVSGYEVTQGQLDRAAAAAAAAAAGGDASAAAGRGGGGESKKAAYAPVAKGPSMSELDSDLVGEATGFVVENGTPGAPTAEELWAAGSQALHSLLLFQPTVYKHFVMRSLHYVYMGTINARGSKERFEPIVVIVAPPSGQYDVNLRVLVYTRLGDRAQLIEPDAEALEEKVRQERFWTASKTIPKPIAPFVDAVIRTFPGRQTDALLLNVERVARVDEHLRNELLSFEVKDPLRRKVFSVGLLHALRGQLTEGEHFANCEMTPLLEEFMAFLGDKISMPGWMGYRGDLDVTSDASTGEHGLYRRWKGFEIMFHSSTLLPYQDGTTEQLHRKRRIGNDISVIVFQEGGTYTPPIRSQFLHAYYVVAPVIREGVTYYRLSVSTQEGVPDIPPAIPEGGLFAKTPAFRAFLLAKLVNGQLAALNHPFLREKIWARPKCNFLKTLVSSYGPKSSSRRLFKRGEE